MNKPVAAVTTTFGNKIKAGMRLNAIAHITNSWQVIQQNTEVVFYIGCLTP